MPVIAAVVADGDPRPAGPAPRAVDPAFDAVLHLWAARGGERIFPVAGESMLPILAGVDRVRARMAPARVRRGDIVLFYRRGRLIVHRIVGRGREGWRTRGDAARGFDPEPLPPERILGVATHLLGSGWSCDLEGPGAGVLRLALALASGAAGRLGLDPCGPGPGAGLGARARDGLLAGPYRAFLRASFGGYERVARLVRRMTAAWPDPGRRFLIDHLRPVPGSAQPRRGPVRGMPSDADGWRRLARHAAGLGLGPLFLHNLKERGLAAGVPPAVLRDLERTHYAQTLYNARALADLGLVLESFAAAGLHPVVLKGGALAGRAYEQLGHRPLSDLDLLLPRGEVAAADVVLRRLGYRQEVPAGWEGFYAAHHHGAPYLPPRGHPRLEIHTGLIDPRHPQRLDLEPMMGRTVEATFGSAAARTLRPEDQLVHACLHLAVSERFARGMKDLADIDLLLRSAGGLDLSLLRGTAGQPGIGRAIYYAIALSRDLFDSPVDPALSRLLRAYRLPLHEDLVLRWLARSYVAAGAHGEAPLGLASAKWSAGVLLGEPRAARRLRRLAARLAGGERAERPSATA